MGWSDFLGDIDWGGIITTAIPAAISTYMTTSANTDAANAIAGANTQAAQISANANIQAMREAAAYEAAAAQQQRDANAKSQARLDPILAGTRPAIDYLGRVVSDNSITPEQQQRIMDTRRETANQLASRLGGRSATAIATRAAGNLENQIYDSNRARSDDAAARLAGVNVSATNAASGADINLGNQLAAGQRQLGATTSNLTSLTGTNTANLAGASGQELANAGLANAGVTQRAIGEVLSPSLVDVLKSYNADSRKSSYDTGVNSSW
jgi:hypothetical protein